MKSLRATALNGLTTGMIGFAAASAMLVANPMSSAGPVRLERSEPNQVGGGVMGDVKLRTADFARSVSREMNKINAWSTVGPGTPDFVYMEGATAVVIKPRSSWVPVGLFGGEGNSYSSLSSRTGLVQAGGVVQAASVADAIGYIREASGLTWQQLASAFGVSRRAVHHWMQGGKMTAMHEERARQLSAAVREIQYSLGPDRAQDSVRSALLETGAGGTSVLSKMRADAFSGRGDINRPPAGIQDVAD